jgi:hypothetical protein
VLIKRVRKMSGHDKETTTEAPVDALYIQGPTERPASWNRKFGESDLIDLSEFVEEALLVLHDLENAVVQPDQRGIVSVGQGFLDKLHLGIHQGIELLRILLRATVGRESALVGHGLLIQNNVGEREGHDAEGRKMGENAELGDEDGISEEENRQTTQGQIVEEGEVFKEPFGLLVDIVVTGDDHAYFYLVEVEVRMNRDALFWLA